jgi:hypothetical protein
MIVLLGLPQRRDFLRRYAGQPKTEVYFVMLFEVGLAVAGALAGHGWGLRAALAGSVPPKISQSALNASPARALSVHGD